MTKSILKRNTCDVDDIFMCRCVCVGGGGVLGSYSLIE